jgi:hypothetical protein
MQCYAIYATPWNPWTLVEAMEDMERAVELAPKWADALEGLARLREAKRP